MPMPKRDDGKPDWPAFFADGDAEVDEEVIMYASSFSTWPLRCYHSQLVSLFGTEIGGLSFKFIGAAKARDKPRMKELHDQIRDYDLEGGD